MPVITRKGLKNEATFGTAPYGNTTTLEFPLATAANGSVVNGDSTAAILNGDVVRIGIIPAGFRLHDSLAIVSTAFTAAVTGRFGFAYVDGVDDTDVPQDDDYFGTGVAINAAGRYAASNATVRPVTLPKDAYLTLTTAGANNAKVAALSFLLRGELVGV